MKTSKDGVKNYNDPHDADNTYTWYDSNPATNGGNAGTSGSGTDTEDFVKSLNDANYGGNSDWRMPTIKELTSIVNYSISYPRAIDTGYFPNTVAALYWSSTTDADSTPHAWLVHFGYGSGYGNYKRDSSYVRAVRGGQTQSAYANNGDDTVTDTSTGLMWQQGAPSNKMTWVQALAYCEGLNLGGHTDWRLPTIKELQSLVDYNKYDPAINETYFPNAFSSFYWSSTTDATVYTQDAWGVYFGTGQFFDFNNNKSPSYYVRAVRGGQAGSLGNLVISPTSRSVSKDMGTTTFSVSNTGTGTMPWTAAATSGSSWLSITSGTSGTDTGTITCSFTSNTGASARTATIRITASGATGSPVDVTVTQAGAGAGAELLAASFVGSGLYIYNSGNAAWSKISSSNPESMVYSGSTLYAGFGASGLQKFDGAAWTQLTPLNPENMVASNSALYVNFGASYGLYRWDGAAWTQLTTANPENMVVSGSTLYVDFGALGLYKWDGAVWSQLTGSTPAIMAISN